MTRKPFLSIVVPAYKEEKRLAKNIGDFIRFYKDFEPNVELVFVDDGSPDNTSKLIKDSIKGLKAARLIQLPKNLGKGDAVRTGMMSATGDFLLFADADNSTPIWQAQKFLEEADKQTILIGSRYIPGALLQKKQPAFRVLGGRVLNLFVQALLLPGVRDTQCGFKLFPRDAVRKIFPKLRLHRFGFDLEVLAVAKRFGYKIRELPVVWKDDPRSTVSPVKDGFRLLADIIRVRIALIRGFYR